MRPTALQEKFYGATLSAHSAQRAALERLSRWDCPHSLARPGGATPLPDLFDRAWCREKFYPHTNLSKNLAALRDLFSSVAGLLSLTNPDACAGPDMTPQLTESILSGNVLRIEQLLILGADVNAADAKGRTPAMAAAQMGNAPLLQRLQHEFYADLSRRDRHGRDVLDYALDAPNPSAECMRIVLADGRALPQAATPVAPDMLEENLALPRYIKALLMDRRDIFNEFLKDGRVNFIKNHEAFDGRDLYNLCLWGESRKILSWGITLDVALDPKAQNIVPRGPIEKVVFSDAECRELFRQRGGDMRAVTFYSPYDRGTPILPN